MTCTMFKNAFRVAGLRAPLGTSESESEAHASSEMPIQRHFQKLQRLELSIVEELPGTSAHLPSRIDWSLRFKEGSVMDMSFRSEHSEHLLFEKKNKAE